MSGHTRRQVLAGCGTVGATMATAAVGRARGRGAAAACDATVYLNARRSNGEPTLEVPPAETTIRGTSTCEPGSELTVRARSSGGDSPFVMQVETRVSDDRRWSAAFDFEAQPVGTTFTLTVLQENDPLATVEDCEVVAEPGTATLTRTPTEPGTPTETRTALPTDTPGPTTWPGGSPTTSGGPQQTTGRVTPTAEIDLATPTPTPDPAWHGLLRPLATFTVVAMAGLLSLGIVLARWRLAPASEE